MAVRSVLSSSRHPFQLFLLALCIVSGLPTLLGANPGPASIEALLPELMVRVWSFMLVVGAAISLIGAALKNRVNGILVEQVGLVMVGVAAVFYAFGIFIVIGFQVGAISASIILGFGAACLYRWYQLQRYIKAVRDVIAERADNDNGTPSRGE